MATTYYMSYLLSTGFTIPVFLIDFCLKKQNRTNLLPETWYKDKAQTGAQSLHMAHPLPLRVGGAGA